MTVKRQPSKRNRVTPKWWNTSYNPEPRRRDETQIPVQMLLRVR
jgi:hypothetical protein